MITNETESNKTEKVQQKANKTEKPQQKPNETAMEVNHLQERVKTGLLKNEEDAQEVKAEGMTDGVKKAEDIAQELQTEYHRAVNMIREHTHDTRLAQAHIQKLLDKARQVSIDTSEQLNQLKDEAGMHREQLNSLSNTIRECNDRMCAYLTDINQLYHKN